jgi:hypothetical protein
MTFENYLWLMQSYATGSRNRNTTRASAAFGRKIPSLRVNASNKPESVRRNGAGSLRDELIMLDPAMLGEIEHRLLVEAADVEIAFGDENLVAAAGGLRNDFAGRSNDATAGKKFAALLIAGLGDADHPCAVLIGTRLHAQVIVEAGEMIVDRDPGQMRRRVVAEQDEFDALHAHDPIGLGPAPIVADAHSDIGAECAPDRKAKISWLEIALLQVLKGIVRPVVGMAGQMHLAILADNLRVLVDQDRGVVAACRAVLLGQFGVAQIETDAERFCRLE